IDVLEKAEHLDLVILVSGDGDFRRLVEAVQRKGLRVSVVSTIKSSPPMVADELRRQADDFIELSELAPLIARMPSERPARPAGAAAYASRDQFGEAEDGAPEAQARSA
ncbi:MAG: NYN domain-containing protein, partial [Reyranella sp.]